MKSDIWNGFLKKTCNSTDFTFVKGQTVLTSFFDLTTELSELMF